MNKNCVRTVIIALVLGFIPILGMKKVKIPKLKVPSSVQGSLLNTKRFLSNEKAIAEEKQRQDKFFSNNPIVKNQPEKVIEGTSAQAQNIKDYIKNDRGSIGGHKFSETYFTTAPSLFEKYGAKRYSIKREDGESSDKELGQRNKRIPQPINGLSGSLNNLQRNINIVSNLTNIIQILIYILGGATLYVAYDIYTTTEIYIANLERILATGEKNIRLILNHSFSYSTSKWNYPEVEQHIKNFSITKETYNHSNIQQQFYSALVDAFKQKNIKIVTPDDILNLINETENILKEGIFKEDVCINKKMNPLAALYLKQTTQLLKGESAYILGTLGYIEKLKEKDSDKSNYFIQRLNAPWWKKALYFFN